MAKRKQKQICPQSARSLVLCEGWTEYWCVFSNPCFEIAFLFHFSKDAKIFTSNKEVEDALNPKFRRIL